MLRALERGPVTLRYIRRFDAALYRDSGWHVVPLPNPHGAHAMLAWRAG